MGCPCSEYLPWLGPSLVPISLTQLLAQSSPYSVDELGRGNHFTETWAQRSMFAYGHQKWG